MSDSGASTWECDSPIAALALSSTWFLRMSCEKDVEAVLTNPKDGSWKKHKTYCATYRSRSPGKRVKSPSVVTHSAPCSMASAA
jgi:hypothetical protein